MKRILCYGDSNTWGYDPTKKFRYPADIRWTGVLSSALGAGCLVLEEGLNARTTVWDDPFESGKNGKTMITPVLATHCPLDLVIIMLGTNDLKSRFGVSACDISLGAGALVDIALASKSGDHWGTPKVLLVSPIHIGDNIRESEFGEFFDINSVVAVSKQLSGCYKKVAAVYGCAFFDAASVAEASPSDALHLDEAGHHRLGLALAEQVRTLLGS